jgi:succinylglutamate desuccinylase
MSPQRAGFLPHTIVEQPGLPQRRRDEKQQIIPASEAEYLSAGIAPGNEMGVIRIELLEATGNFLLPISFGIHINGHIQAVQQGARHCRTDLGRKLQGRL